MIGFVCLPEDVDSLVNATQEELQRLYEYPESFDGILTDVKRNLLKDFELDKQKNSFGLLGFAIPYSINRRIGNI